MTVEIFHPKAPAIFYIITCLLSCVNLCNIYICVYCIYIYIYIHTCIYHMYIIYQKPKSLVVWEGRPDFSFLFKSCEIDKSQGRLVK